MSVPKLWTEKFKIHTFLMNPKGEAHLTTICNFLQEAASKHAQHAGFGYHEMMENSQVWVLSRMKLQMDYYPGWNEEIRLETWSRGNEGIFYVRDFCLYDQRDQVVGKASSSWAAINLKNRRPELVKNLEDRLYSFKERRAFQENLEKLPELNGGEKIWEYQVQYSDLDIVYHVNNVKYIELIFNSLPFRQIKANTVKSFEINYLSEAKYGETLVVNHSISTDTSLINIVRKEDGRETCRAKIEWS